jgi:3-oxoadipate enol-lactonase
VNLALLLWLWNIGQDTSDGSPGRAVDSGARDTVRKDVSASNPEAYAQTCESVIHLDHKDPLYQEILCPVVFVVGDKDLISPVQRSEDLAKLVGGRSWVDVVKSGHQPILEDLSGVRRAIDGLFEEFGR